MLDKLVSFLYWSEFTSLHWDVFCSENGLICEHLITITYTFVRVIQDWNLPWSQVITSTGNTKMSNSTVASSKKLNYCDQSVCIVLISDHINRFVQYGWDSWRATRYGHAVAGSHHNMPEAKGRESPRLGTGTRNPMTTTGKIPNYKSTSLIYFLFAKLRWFCSLMTSWFGILS